MAANRCTHLQDVRNVVPAAEGCEECLALGETWTDLRLCLACGHVGCCNDSLHRHAERHFQETGHPVMRSLKEGENWMWCYEDNLLMTDRVAVRADDESGKGFLRRHQLFSGLADEDLDRLYGMARILPVPRGDAILEEGAAGDMMYVILEGEVEVTKRSGELDVLLGVRGPGEIVGEMALLEEAPRTATVRAAQDSLLLSISKTAFETLLTCSSHAAADILHTMTSRLRSQEALLAQQQKLVALGTLAAGLAHELNNPAAAIRRSAAHLQETLAAGETATLEMGALALPRERLQQLDEIREGAQARAEKSDALGPLERSEREDAIGDWLEDRGVSRGWELAPVLLAAGWDEEALTSLTSVLSGEQVPVVARWLAARAAADALLKEVRVSSEAVSAIVSGVKQYSHLDQAPVQEVDVRTSLENTLLILKHQLKGVQVVKEYADDIPEIEAFGSELSQVWTNLIDNAIDAMDGAGELVLRVFPEADTIVVEIQDSGPGIPAEIRDRLFDAFFTTKAPGKGTGQGLHVVHSIVTQRHRGHISIRSESGQTVFRVVLPARLRRR